MESRRLKWTKVVKDYMKISYADSGVLYIPVAQMDLIQKYAGADAKKAEAQQTGDGPVGQDQESGKKKQSRL